MQVCYVCVTYVSLAPHTLTHPVSCGYYYGYRRAIQLNFVLRRLVYSSMHLCLSIVMLRTEFLYDEMILIQVYM